MQGLQQYSGVFVAFCCQLTNYNTVTNEFRFWRFDITQKWLSFNPFKRISQSPPFLLTFASYPLQIKGNPTVFSAVCMFKKCLLQKLNYPRSHGVPHTNFLIRLLQEETEPLKTSPTGAKIKPKEVVSIINFGSFVFLECEK